MKNNASKRPDVNVRVKELQQQVDSLKDLVNSLLSVICEEPDGVHSGSAPSLAGQPREGYCM
jgi:hypothetical protein